MKTRVEPWVELGRVGKSNKKKKKKRGKEDDYSDHLLGRREFVSCNYNFQITT